MFSLKIACLYRIDHVLLKLGFCCPNLNASCSKKLFDENVPLSQNYPFHKAYECALLCWQWIYGWNCHWPS